ncbi:hypothetical protein IAQ61_005948 [Plenodomus lingam]|uniref:F-box domain-containing protein n=1 Tax=Leptosphaeria maculans (strain JN3 / isolate v23.1.3 / race Av1-4-5-6-7-8) TaxID=985895 RepID=E4ZLK1_LEPMJ|nr:hypothetical protein LEMA_P053870.1 [Plenodomus lingam JN3]KAH9870473.1 hypothetical protein IAQ61_005948 [Plenodomus lingam]CBX92681.1 hypothetical protein LEMA_P053870.1 [Plenodomus lingam JN3]
MSGLESIPPEILYKILALLEPVHTLTEPLTLLALSATSKHFNAVVEEHANNALKKHGLPLPKRAGKLTTLRRKWLGDICQFCKRASKRRACFYSDVVCCKDCDRTVFPKITMTAAMSTYNLSKLDLFTPNELHPYLEALTVGTASVMGGQAIMISEPDVLARRDHIYALVSQTGNNVAKLHGRAAMHSRIQAHLCIVFCPVRRRWCQTTRPNPPLSRLPASMQTRASRMDYVKRMLRSERILLGMSPEEADADVGYRVNHCQFVTESSGDAAFEEEMESDDEGEFEVEPRGLRLNFLGMDAIDDEV